ncbi:MAG: Unknown protein [uncultured Sulfurovum sp.]|uniref:Uncharacterized protein n=1 Tax=uncultured Sulfurovum sp. TaxID=269237 RepID=A0A6S6T4I0_9BACT|nr:MAG: Unknown protein [uncultured Sulfurovum sp.]
MVLPTKKTNIEIAVKIKTGVKMNLLLRSIFLLLLLHNKLIACAGTWQEMYLKNEYYNFTDPDMIDLPRDNPLYKLSGTYAAHNARFEYFAKEKKEANIEAWYAYFNGNFTHKEINDLFYQKDSIEKSAKIYANNKEYPSFSQYIIFLHAQNQLAQNNEKIKSHTIINQGLALLKKEEKPFFKERYLYLLMRLYHHEGQYNKVLDLYVNNLLIINQKGIVKEWIEALRAGAYQHLEQNTKANQLYAKIFSTHKTNPHYGYYDFKVNSNEEWQELLKSSENNETKALYHFLRAMQWNNEPLHELKSIATLAPNSIWFERLSYMIMQELQNKRYTIMVHSGKKDKYFKAQVNSYKLQKKHFLAILEKLEKQTFFTLYSKLYLNVLEYNSLERKEVVQLHSLANYKQKPYSKLLTYIYGLHQLSSSSYQEQQALYFQLKPLLPKFSQRKQTSILRYTALQISTLNPDNTIEKTLNKLFAQNKNHRAIILKALNYADATKFQSYVEQKKRSFFKEKVFKKTMNNLEKGDVAKILATLYLQENNFEKAQVYLRQVPKKNEFNLYNPFNVTINGSNRTKSKQTYSQKKFAETMVRIQKTLEKEPKSALNHFLYANALYNKSWFGNFPMSSVFYRSTYLTKGGKLPKTMDLSQAQEAYELALKYAKNEEFKAKITYQLLKIKFNQAISDTYKYDNNTWRMPRFNDGENGTKKVIDILKASKNFSEAIKDYQSDYGHTHYGSKVIEQCITFRYF